MKTLEERIAEFKQGWTEEKKEIYRDCGDCWDKGYEDGREEALEIINELQQKNDLLQLDFNAAQEIMGGMNKEIEELKKQNKSWQQMVDSTNQTNQALCKRLRGSENETI